MIRKLRKTLTSILSNELLKMLSKNEIIKGPPVSITNKYHKLVGWIKAFRDHAAEAGELSFPPIFFEKPDELMEDLTK